MIRSFMSAQRKKSEDMRAAEYVHVNMSMVCEKVFIKTLMTQNEKELIQIIKNLQDKY